MAARGRRWPRAAGVAVVVTVCAVGVLELALQAGARVVGDRASAWDAGASNRVLCVGDSHTYGAGVEREEAYPARVQRLLDEREPGEHSVINMGLPGLSSTQLRNRVPVWIQRYRPTVLVVWVGVNDSWNRAELEEGALGAAGTVDAWLGRLRLYRLVRVALHDRGLRRYTAADREDRVWHVEKVEGEFEKEVWTVRHDGVTERIAHGEHEPPPGAPDERADAMRARLARNLREIARYARASGVPVVLLTYPLEASWFHLVNEVERDVSRGLSLALVETGIALARIPDDERDWTGVAHPGPRIYAEIAEEIAPVVAAADDGGRLRERFPPKTPAFRLKEPHWYEPIRDSSGNVVLAEDAGAAG